MSLEELECPKGICLSPNIGKETHHSIICLENALRNLEYTFPLIRTKLHPPRVTGNLINGLNPQCVVLGRPLSDTHVCLLPVIDKVVKERALTWSRENGEIVIASNGIDFSVIGGITAIYHNIRIRPTVWL
jgi:hypothetical protein